jgi:hypothetical protein
MPNHSDLLPQMLYTKPNMYSHDRLSSKQWMHYTPMCLYVKHLLWCRHSPHVPCHHLPHACQEWDPVPDCFTLPDTHSAGLGLQSHWLLMPQAVLLKVTLRGEPLSLPRKWHPECFSFSFCFVLRHCQNESYFKSPTYFGSIEVPRCFWMFMIVGQANLKPNECV